jgi:Family of unknown function (DUF6788)
MMSSIKLSQYRHRIRQLLVKIEKLSFQFARADLLVQGTPGEVFRTCGKKTCKCTIDPDKRHGPYPVIQIYQNKKQRQVTIKKNQKEIWQRAKNYQKQMKNLLELKKNCAELTGTVDKILRERIEKWSK